MVVIWHCWTTMIMRLGFCQLNDQTNLNWYHVWGMLQLYNNFFSGSNQSRFFSWELLTIRDVQFRTSYLCSYQCSPQVPTRLSWRLPKQTPSSLCHASPSCSMAICGREKNHWSQCIKGHIFFPPSVQRHAKRYGEEGFSFISAVSYEKNYMKIFWGGLKPPHCKSTC